MSIPILNHIRARGFLPETHSNRPLSAIKLNSSTLEGGALVSLVFLPDSATPRYALRVARHPAQGEGLLANYTALEALRGVSKLQQTVPKPVACDAFEGVPFTLETCLDGSPLAIEIAIADTEGDQARAAKMLENVCEWLWRLHSSTTTGEITPFMPTYAEAARHLQRKGVLTSEETQSLLKHLAPLLAQPIPQVRSHNDMHPNNLLYRADGTVGVVDWERSAPDSPLRDLFTLFTTAWLFPPDRIVPAEARYRELWRGKTQVSRAFLVSLSRYTHDSVVCQRVDFRRAFLAYLVHAAVGILETGEAYAEERLPALSRLLKIEAL
jgi:aminoglycoside phosphotransferase (APT) family kinase protein